MPKRMISDSIWKSKKLRSVMPPEFRVEYNWIVCAFEDNGVAEYDPEVLWADAYALARPGWTAEKVKQVLDEFIRVGLLQRYEAEDKTWICLVGSEKSGFLPPPSQRYSKLPSPPAQLTCNEVVKPVPMATIGQPYGNPMSNSPIAVAGIGLGAGIGSGSGVGSGDASTGSENGKTQLATSTSSDSPGDDNPRPTLVRKKSVGNSFLPKWDEQSNSPDLTTSSKTSTPVKFDPLNFKEPIGDDPVKEVRRVMFYCFKEMEDAYWRKNIPTREDLIRAYPAMKKQVPNDFNVSGQWYREIRVVNPDCPICQGVGDTFIDHPSYTSGMALLGIECDCVTYQEPVWKR